MPQIAACPGSSPLSAGYLRGVAEEWPRSRLSPHLSDLQRPPSGGLFVCRFAIAEATFYIRPMPRKPLEPPPAVARAFVRDMKAFFACGT